MSVYRNSAAAVVGDDDGAAVGGVDDADETSMRRLATTPATVELTIRFRTRRPDCRSRCFSARRRGRRRWRRCWRPPSASRDSSIGKMVSEGLVEVFFLVAVVASVALEPALF